MLGGAWILDITDAVTGTPLLFDIPLVAGVDLFAGYSYLGFTGQLFVYTDGNPFADPTLNNLGIDSNLYFQTSAA